MLFKCQQLLVCLIISTVSSQTLYGTLLKFDISNDVLDAISDHVDEIEADNDQDDKLLSDFDEPTVKLLNVMELAEKVLVDPDVTSAWTKVQEQGGFEEENSSKRIAKLVKKIIKSSRKHSKVSALRLGKPHRCMDGTLEDKILNLCMRVEILQKNPLLAKYNKWWSEKSANRGGWKSCCNVEGSMQAKMECFQAIQEERRGRMCSARTDRSKLQKCCKIDEASRSPCFDDYKKERCERILDRKSRRGSDEVERKPDTDDTVSDDNTQAERRDRPRGLGERGLGKRGPGKRGHGESGLERGNGERRLERRGPGRMKQDSVTDENKDGNMRSGHGGSGQRHVPNSGGKSDIDLDACEQGRNSTIERGCEENLMDWLQDGKLISRTSFSYLLCCYKTKNTSSSYIVEAMEEKSFGKGRAARLLYTVMKKTLMRYQAITDATLAPVQDITVESGENVEVPDENGQELQERQEEEQWHVDWMDSVESELVELDKEEEAIKRRPGEKRSPYGPGGRRSPEGPRGHQGRQGKPRNVPKQNHGEHDLKDRKGRRDPHIREDEDGNQYYVDTVDPQNRGPTRKRKPKSMQ